MADESRYSDISDWENEAMASLEDRIESSERTISDEQNRNREIVYPSFQGAAEAVSNLYRERQSSTSWMAFQTSALAVTDLYKECKDSFRRGMDFGVAIGSRRRSKEVVQWLRKHNRMVRREDLISFLCNRSLPARVKPLHPHHRRKVERAQGVNAVAAAQKQDRCKLEQEKSLQVFHDAVQLRELEKGMHVISVHRQRGSTSPSSQRIPASCSTSRPPVATRISPERRKRSPTNNADSDGESNIFDSPQRKRYKMP